MEERKKNKWKMNTLGEVEKKLSVSVLYTNVSNFFLEVGNYNNVAISCFHRKCMLENIIIKYHFE